MTHAINILLLVSLFFLVGCDLGSGEPVETVVATAVVEARETGLDSRSFGQPFDVVANLCDGSDYVWNPTSSIARRVTVSFTQEAVLETALGPQGLAAARTRIAAQAGLEIGQEIGWEWNSELSFPTGKYTIRQVQPKEIWRIGEISVPQISNQTFQYELLVGTTFEPVSYQELDCDEAAAELVGTPVAAAVFNNASATDVPQILSLDNFTDSQWFNNSVKYRNYDGVCTYEGDGETARLVSNSDVASYCSFTIMQPDGREFVALSEFGSLSADVNIESGSGLLGQGIGLYSAPDWWMTCTLRQDADTGEFVSVLETSSPEGFNQYLVAPGASSTITISANSEGISCTQNDRLIGIIPISRLPFELSQEIVMVTNSNRSTGLVVTTIDNIVIKR